ncbi:MFS transporter, partial [Azospirillum sp. TSA6c]|uniref:MFS transporter n=1 Tax=Azospirillum sp. TSA6c TaxID=709813 RepID=UPI001FFFAF55
MQSKSVMRPHVILPALTMIGIALFSCLIYAKFYGNAAEDSAFSAMQIALDSKRNHMAILAAAIPATLWSAGLLLPSFRRLAGATPLRGLMVVAAAMLAFCAMTLPGLAGLLPAEAVRGFFYDAAVLLVVCLLLVFEGLLLLATRPGRGEQEPASAVGRMRAALFLFMLAEELSRSFLPLYARELYSPVPGLSETLMMGLPIGLFMALVAVFTPFAGHWADRFGSRRTLLLGTLPAVAGFIGTAMAGSMAELLLWRGACALGYAVMFIGAQGFVA